MKRLIQPADASLDFFEFDTISEKMKVKQLFTLSNIRTELTNPPLVYINGLGFFVLDVTDSISSDNGLSVIVGANGQRWKREIESFSFDITTVPGVSHTVNDKELIKFIADNGINLSINSALEVVVSTSISTDVENILTLKPDKSLFVPKTAKHVSLINYNGINGILTTTYSDGQVITSQLADINSVFFNITGTVGLPIVLDVTNKNLQFKGTGLIASTDVSNRIVNLEIVPYTYTYQRNGGNTILTQVPEFVPIIGIHRNGLLQTGVEDYTASYIGGFLNLVFVDDFGSSSGAVITGEKIEIICLPNN